MPCSRIGLGASHVARLDPHLLRLVKVNLDLESGLLLGRLDARVTHAIDLLDDLLHLGGLRLEHRRILSVNADRDGLVGADEDVESVAAHRVRA